MDPLCEKENSILPTAYQEVEYFSIRSYNARSGKLGLIVIIVYVVMLSTSVTRYPTQILRNTEDVLLM